MTRPVPADFRLSLDPSVRAVDGGRALVGGSPVRIIRLTEAGAHLVDRLRDGHPIGKRSSAQRLARRLLDAGLAHPRPPTSTFEARDVTVVIPTFGDPAGLVATLDALAGQGIAKIVVVDDATPDPVQQDGIRRATHRAGATLIRLDRNGGPSVARNAGLRTVGTPLVAFVDRDVVPEEGWLRCLLDHFADPSVVAVAPRIVPVVADGEPPTSWLAGRLRRYERSRSPLDLGRLEARVQPRSRVSYVPSTVLLARTEAIAGPDSFDESMRWGEDVDLVWRLARAGGTVRYEPASHAAHPIRPTLRRLLRQRFDYGTAAAELARRHPGAVPPVAVSAWSTASWLLVATGQPVSGLAVAAIATAQLPAKLRPLPQPWLEAARLAGLGTWHAWRPLANAVVRPWWPFALLAAAVSRRARRAVVVATAATALADWWDAGRPSDPVSYAVLHVLDDAAYGAGVWAGCLRTGVFDPLVPDFGSWPSSAPRAAGASSTRPVPAPDPSELPSSEPPPP